MNITVRFDHRPDLGPIRDQGPRPTCLSLAATAAHEYARGSKVPLSPEYLHHFASDNGLSKGVLFSDISRALESPGQPAESDCRYYSEGPPLGWLPPKGVRLYRRKSKLMRLDVDRLSELLTDGHVPVLGITVPQPFYSPTPPWVISPNGPVRGLHAVVAVGLGSSGAKQCFLIRNSWGSDWGDSGYAWLDEVFMVQHLRYLLALTEEVI